MVVVPRTAEPQGQLLVLGTYFSYCLRRTSVPSKLASMALLYERSRTWRALVRATQNPWILAGFFGVSVGGASIIAWSSQKATDAVAEETKKEMEQLKRKDIETARYAKHSKVALGKMFDSVRGIEEEAPAKGAPPAMRLPPIQWHPGAVEREKKAEAAAAAAAAASATAASEAKSERDKAVSGDGASDASAAKS